MKTALHVVAERGDFGRRGGRGGGRGGRGARDFQQQPYDQSIEQYPQQGGQRQGDRRRGPSESTGGRPNQSRGRGESGSGYEPQQNEAGGGGYAGARRRQGGPSLPVKPAGAFAPATQRAPRPQGAGRQQQAPHQQQDASGGNEGEAQAISRSTARRRNKRPSARDGDEQADATVGELKSEEELKSKAGAEGGGTLLCSSSFLSIRYFAALGCGAVCLCYSLRTQAARTR